MIADRVLQAFHDPFVVETLEIAIEVSIGLATSPADGEDVDTLLQHADVAMYAAKNGRLGVVRFHRSLEVFQPEQLTMFGELRRAIDLGELLLQYQPKVDLGTARISGVEALVRWRRADGTIVPPMDFLPLAEHTALIHPLTDFVLDTALRQCRIWRDEGLDLTVAVNVSCRSLLDRSFPAKVHQALEAHGVAADLLEVEVTESTIMADPVCAREVLEAVHELGVKVAIDDFGTGYSSLTYLKSLPIDTLKIDRSFVTDLLTDANDFVIVQSVIDLGTKFGMRIVAEGVEDAATAAALYASGCHSGQGYFWRRPVSADEISELMRPTIDHEG